MKNILINACSDLGVHVCGAENGPKAISKLYKNNKNINNIYDVCRKSVSKSLDKTDKEKNLDSLNEFNERLYNTIINSLDDDILPITLGGDHSVVIASALASLFKNRNLGIIWIDSHGDYNNFKTTVSGNLHGLPFAAITGFDDTSKLSSFYKSDFFNCKNAVLVGARDIDPWEIGNLEKAGIKIFTTADIKNYGSEYVMNKAIEIASKNTNGLHISYDLDVIDPIVAPGVSIPAINGINKEEAYEIMDILVKNRDKIKSLDIVEYNPDKDIKDQTLKIACDLLDKFLEN